MRTPRSLWRTVNPPGRCPFCWPRRPTTHVVKWPAETEDTEAGESPQFRSRTYVCADDARRIIRHQRDDLGFDARAYRYRFLPRSVAAV